MTGALDGTALRRLWPEVLEVIKQSSRRTKALLESAQVSSVTGERVTLAAVSPAIARMIGEDSNTAVLRAALTQVIGGTWDIVVEVGDGSPPAAGAAPRAAGRAPSSEAGPEPDPRDDTEEDTAGGPVAVHDPESEALKLLQDQLGARPVGDQ
ncbi:MAG: hypothetical protein ABI368_08705 [Jatrophihabitantaceae bacterium]